MLKKKTAPTFSSLFLGPLTAALIVDLNSPFITESCHLWLESPSKTGRANFQKCRALFSILPCVALTALQHLMCSKPNFPLPLPPPHPAGNETITRVLLFLKTFTFVFPCLPLPPLCIAQRSEETFPAWRMKFSVHSMAGLVAAMTAAIQT